jgi:hypothetical protein
MKLNKFRLLRAKHRNSYHNHIVGLVFAYLVIAIKQSTIYVKGGVVMWKKKTVLLMGLTALLAIQVNAQSSISLGPQLGYYKAQDADNGSIMGGVACRLKFTSILGAEA